ncbi:MAG: SurA N-terminal domain-containing protein [Gemmatimonadales bacterium]|nr:SurA N-terminal domain-containing protein [Gemmatimonadales bacterium]
MQAFRNSAKLVSVIFAVILLVWLLSSSGIADGSGIFSSTTVGRINGKTVDTRQYEARVRQLTEGQQRQASGPLTLEDQDQLRNQAWEEFISTSIMERQYREHSLSVSEDEVADAVRNNPPQELLQTPEFKTDSQFDMSKYQRWLTSSAATPYVDAIGAQYRDILLRNKLMRLVTADIVLSDAALWEHYRDEHEQARIGLTAIIPRNIIPDTTATVAPADVDAYYRAHQEEFRREPTAYLSYVSVNRTPNGADTAAVLDRTRTIRAEIEGGAPFDEVAKRESSDTVSGSRGGDLGEWTKGQFDPAFDAVAFTIPLRKLSEPVVSSFGYHLIEITSRTGDKARGRHILVPIEVTGAHRDMLDAQADTLDRLSGSATGGATLDTIARALKLPIGRTLPVSKGTRAQAGRTVVPDAGVWAFQARAGDISQVIEAPDAYYVFRLDSVQAGGIPPLTAIRPAVESVVRDVRKREAARQVAQDYVKRVREGSKPAQAAAALRLAYREFGPFTRLSPPLDIPAIVGAAFGVEVGKQSDILDVKDGLYVVQVLDRTRADSAAFVKDLDTYRAKTVQDLRQQRVRNYLAGLRAQAKIVDNREKVLRQTQAQAQNQPIPS